jgi:DNA polymerase
MKAFGADAFMSDEEIKEALLAWRAASPAIVELWGGQERNWRPEYYGIEGAFVRAVLYPGASFQTHGVNFQMRGDVLFLRLLSGREMAYHRPRLTDSTRRPGTYSMSYEGWNSNPKNGPLGWVRIETWGGRLTENVVQATARDIQWHGLRALEAAGYPIVLHVYDENVAEVPEGFGSVEEFERIMGDLPEWCAGWPIKANGGWRGKRYRK